MPWYSLQEGPSRGSLPPFTTRDDSRFCPVLPIILYLSGPFPYLQKNVNMGQEVGRDISLPYLRNLIYIRNDPILLVPYL
jgi:hypothetical protein